MSAKRRNHTRRKGPSLGFWCAFAVIALLAIYMQILANTRPNVDGDRLRIDQFVALAEQGRIHSARILDQDAYIVGVYARDDGSQARYNSPYLKDNNSRERLLDVLLANHVPTRIDQQLSKRLVAPANALIPALLIVVVMTYLIMSSRRGTGLFAMRSGARRMDADTKGKVTFADVAGQDAAVVELKEIGAFLSDPKRFADIGAHVPKGILLFGPPGCGKTLLARAVAGEAGAAFYSISGSDFVELYVGVGAARVRDLFAEARDNSPAIVFIDELDSVGRRRAGVGGSGSSDEQEQALNQILTELDGFSPLDAVVVMAATNRPDILDPALLRPGRFDRTIGLERPDEEARHDILMVHARKKQLAPGVDLEGIARRAVGLSGADLANVMNEAALLSARAGERAIGQAPLDEALRRILEAPERQRRLAMRDRSFVRSTGASARVTFADVAGLDDAITELSEVKQFLAEPARFAAVGARPPRGFLVVGPPGCGKTLLGRAVAAESNATFFPVSATEFVEALVGEGAARVRDLFAQARLEAPAVVFLDEIDAIGTRRSGSSDGHREREQTLNQILIELDGFDARGGVIAMAASNRPEILDPALVRAGRFDRTITVGLPDRKARRAILDVHTAGKPLAADVDLNIVAGLTQGYSGADLANLVNEAALLTVRAERSLIGMSEMEHATERVGLGVGNAHSLSREERSMVAYHEAGHALVGRALPGARVPHRISVVSRGKALGLTWDIDEEDRVVYKRSVLLDRMSGLLGGRAAEELVFGEPTTGACDDLTRVRRIALGMVRQFGMSERLGPMSLGDSADSNGHGRDYSDESARVIDAEVHALVQQAYDRARAVLAGDADALRRVAEALLVRETISREELDELVPATRAIKRPVARRARIDP